ncbi:type VI secretion system-associated FHA domain protein TagH [Arenibaculum pallidiluteum]|uniref:type VI secretion system-associated FHA domain protein TagH n=1 Tax=Arenibaculum pallidiluteum TaxID=2812559 RepID=UPI001A96ABC0|nr:type VI secretion system-associated FHA domain protein TagH [Arenibaculum pallidiluteum]
MSLLLHAEGPGAISLRGSDAAGQIMVHDRLTIGRDEQNDLVLADERMMISSRHCRIERTEQGYALIDHSRNGTFINQASLAVERNIPAALEAGDEIHIGGFTLRVTTIEAAEPAAEPSAEPAATCNAEPDGEAEDLLHAGPVRPPRRPPVLRNATERNGRASVRPAPAPLWPIEADEEQTLFPGFSAGTPVNGSQFGGRAAAPDHVPPEAAVFVQPAKGVARIPDDWDLLAEVGSPSAERGERDPQPSPAAPAEAAAPATAPEPPAAPRTGGGDEAVRSAIAALLQSCGLTAEEVPDARLAAILGSMARILRITVANLEEVLAARSMTKRELGVERTMIGRSDNNILKFGVGPEAAMRLLLMEDAAGFLSADRAIEQAFDDLKAHQLSLVAATQETLETMLRRLAPEAVGAQEPPGWLERAVPLLARARAWDRYVALHGRLSGDLASGDLSIPAEVLAYAFSVPGRVTPEHDKGSDGTNEEAPPHGR